MSMSSNGTHGESEHLVIETQEEFDALIDSEARRLLCVSGQEFLRLKALGELPERPGARALSMMADLATTSGT